MLVAASRFVQFTISIIFMSVCSKGEFINHVDMAGGKVYQMSILLKL